MKRLLKREIRMVNANVLNMHYCRILEQGETMAARDIPAANAKQILWIEDEFRRRLIKLIGHDFYPPDRIEKRPPSDYMKSLLKSVKSKLMLGSKINFRVVVTSSIGHKAAEFIIRADTRIEAEQLAGEEVRKLGLRGARYKIS